MEPAAFFDLDRTLLQGATGPVFSAMLKRVGVLPDRSIPGEGMVFKLFDVIGETIPAMVATRQMARAAAGWDPSLVQEAGRQAAARLVDEVPQAAKALIAEHQAAGRQVVMATTSPFDLVRPLADALGIDDVIATRYGLADGRYDGSIDGPFVWGQGKLAAVREWAQQRGVDVGSSYAYSDSIYDLPLLSAVKFPTAINPDPRLRVLAMVRRWPIQSFDDGSPGSSTFAGLEPQRALQRLALPALVPYARFDIDGIDNIPKQGPAILVGNHRSYFDPMAIGFTVAGVGRPLRFLGKKEVFDVPVVGQLASAMGGIRVERGSGSDEPLRAAADALAAGDLVAIMPEGTIPRGYAFFEPELKGRWGAARLAAMSKAPVIPIGLWGTEKVWPRSSRLPDVTAVGHPPTVRVRVGPPVELKYRSPDVDTRRIMAALVDQLPAEARHRHKPTPEELALTFPPGHKGDPNAEQDRRPGTD